MPSTGVSGVDLYRVNSAGELDFCFGGYSFGEQVVYKYKDLADVSSEQGFEYRLYLPLYNGVKQLEIGVHEGAEFKFIPASEEKPILIYGTSIAQGGCASRPSMAWGSILQRSLGVPVVNLGFSGNGRLESEVIDFINEVDARLYILDCIPNLTSHKDVEERVINAVKQIRSQHDEPILLIEHPGYSNEATNNERRDMISTSNAASRKAYEMLVKEGIDGLYYISKADLECPPETMVDYTHLTDLGMKQQATVVESKVRKILKMPLRRRSR
jgi:lysophospholipase L1-like esterase